MAISVIIRTVLRVVLSIVSFVSLLVGAVFCAIGIWILVNKDKVRGLFNLIDTSSLPMLEKYKTDMEELVDKNDVISKVALAILLIGIAVDVISAVGLFGSLCASRMFLIAYAVVLGFMLACTLSILIICGVFRARISAALSGKLSHLQDNYFISLISMVRNKDTLKAIVTLALNFMHISLQCCGVHTVGDTRNSSSWIASERRIMQLMQEGVLFGMDPPQTTKSPRGRRGSGDEPSPLARSGRATDDSYGGLFDYMPSNVPNYLDFDVPKTFKVPPGSAIPEELPMGFELEDDVFEQIGNTLESVITDTVGAVVETIDGALTLRTPVTCCQLETIKKLLQNEFDLQLMFESLEEMSCVFEKENFGVNKVTCYDAMWNYLMKYVVPVMVLGSILIITMSLALGSAIGIIILGDHENKKR